MAEKSRPTNADGAGPARNGDVEEGVGVDHPRPRVVLDQAGDGRADEDDQLVAEGLVARRRSPPNGEAHPEAREQCEEGLVREESGGEQLGPFSAADHPHGPRRGGEAVGVISGHGVVDRPLDVGVVRGVHRG